MILNRWFAVLVSAAVLVGCTDPTAPPDLDQMDARWAGKAWSGEASAVVASDATGPRLYLFAAGPAASKSKAVAWWRGHEEFVAWPNVISIDVPFNGVGTYVLLPGSAKFEEIVGGDVLNATYSIAPQTTGRLVITSYEPGGVIEGTVSFDAVSSNPYRSFGDRASLEDGHFRARVQSGFSL